ncbi:MAG TPA: carboxyl transferase domain-containing protein [Acidimicrobiales bacterium]|nr:carboxyl transferase domain-containing protein [Acidimicrobiales bacterium]
MPLHPLTAEWDLDLVGGDPLGFPGYAGQLARLDGESVRTGVTDAGYVCIEGRFEVVGGSMGAAAGEKVVRAFRRATDLRLPVVVLAASGGARLQEGMVALAQLARTAGAARRHSEAALLSLSVLGAPTTGGVFASYASLTDLRAAVAGATVGFAGPRVAELVTGRPLPADSHTAESAYAAGLVDAIVADEAAARAWVEIALGLVATRPGSAPPVTGPVTGGDTAWDEVLRARATDRPTGIDWARSLCASWTELRGVDPVVRAGLAELDGRRVVAIATDRRAGTGRPGPDGFRLAQRAVALAGRLGLPIVSFVDTPGAEPGATAEADGIAGEIARTLAGFATAPVPSVAICVGEGGSGGALALAHCDRLLIQEHAVFSVISPEGAALILERDPARAPDVAAHLGLTSERLLELGIVDAVVAEEGDAAEAMAKAVAAALDEAQVGDRDRRWDAATVRWLR